MIQETANESDLLQQAAQLRRWEGEPKDFWGRFAAVLASLGRAARAVLLTRDEAPGAPWKKLADCVISPNPAPIVEGFLRRLEPLAEQSRPEAPLIEELADGGPRAANIHVLALRFPLDGSNSICCGILLLTGTSHANALEAGARIRSVADIPQSYQLFRAAAQTRAEAERYSAVLDLLVALDTEKRFFGAALAFVNAVATRFACDRVSLGWLERGVVRLRVMSRTERFNRRLAAASALESAMEEALDQDLDLVYPASEGARLVLRDHERYAADQRCGHLYSLPLRDQGRATAVLTCERSSRPFDALECRQLRLACDLAARRLSDLHRWDRWFGARWLEAAREQAAKLVGPEHTWAKLLAPALTVLIAFFLLLPVPFRVEGKFLLRAQEVAYLTAPYNGYLREVLVRPGDVVAAGNPLVRLDTEELELEVSAALAELSRYQREAEKARAAGALAEMRVAEALTSQAKARIELVRFRLDHATLAAPFDSVVVEGDLRERLGAPVQQGDVLLRVARLEPLYVEAAIPERDIHEILGRATGEIAFVSQPRRKFPVKMERVEPAAVTRDGQNVFLVRCSLPAPPEHWWRPGMTGVCKIEAGRRTLAWISTRRTLDFLRLWLWW